MINIIILLILILIIIFMSYKRENFKEHRIHTIGDSHSYNGWVATSSMKVYISL